MKIQKTIFLFLILSLVFASSLFAQKAVVKSVVGKVEYSTNGTTWNDLKENMELAKGAIISTSFKSTATIAINDSLLHVKALSRMSLDELSKSQNEVQTDLYLVSGKVQVEVKPRAQQEVVNFNVKSAVATASVRGTGFIFDGSSLLVNHGSVALQANNGTTRSVRGGEFSQVSSRGKVSAPAYVTSETDSVFELDEEGEQDLSDASLDSFENLVADVGREDLFKEKAARPAPGRITGDGTSAIRIEEGSGTSVPINIE